MIAVVSVGLVLVLVLAATGFFSPHSAQGPSAPNQSTGPNPYNMSILSVTGGVLYLGSSSGYFNGFQGASLCWKCPVIPRSTSTYASAVAIVYFNVTNSGSAYHEIDGFNLTTNADSSFQFQFQGPECYEPQIQQGFWNTCVLVGIQPGATQAFYIMIWSDDIPYVAAGGYSLSFLISSNK